VVIVVMLRLSPRRPESTADSSSGRSLRTASPEAQYPSRSHASAGPLGESYGRFLELPVPVVLGVLWLIGAVLLGLLLGTVLVASYSAEVWLLRAIAQLL